MNQVTEINELFVIFWLLGHIWNNHVLPASFIFILTLKLHQHHTIHLEFSEEYKPGVLKSEYVPSLLLKSQVTPVESSKLQSDASGNFVVSSQLFTSLN